MPILATTCLIRQYTGIYQAHSVSLGSRTCLPHVYLGPPHRLQEDLSINPGAETPTAICSTEDHHIKPTYPNTADMNRYQRCSSR